MLKNMLNNALIKTFINVLAFYFFSFFLLFLLIKLLIFYPSFLYILILLILIGLIFDNRINKIRKFIFTILLILHIAFWNFGYWQTEVIIIKELFWYSLVLMSCFVWHVLILNWVFRLVDKAGWDYGRYLVSRVSLVTSLMGIIWIMQWFIYILEDKYTYELENKIYPRALRTNGPPRLILTISNLGLVLCYIWLAVLEYFSVIFQNYTKMLIGKGEITRFWKMPVKFYMFLIVTLIISFTIIVPRVYIIWIILVVWNVIKILLVLPKHGWPFKRFLFTMDLLIARTEDEMLIKHKKRFSHVKMEPEAGGKPWYKKIDRLTGEWKLIYEEGLFRDYLYYSRIDFWYPGKGDFAWVIDIYHVWYDIFNYWEDRELRILGRICYNYWIDTQYYWGDIISKIESITILADKMKDVEYYCSSPLVIKKVIPYVLEEEGNCNWLVKEETYKEKNWLAHIKTEKYIYLHV